VIRGSPGEMGEGGINGGRMIVVMVRGVRGGREIGG